MQHDFKAIATTPILDVAKMLDLPLTQKGEQFVGNCPISGINNPTAFKVTPKLNRFICFCTECKKLEKSGGDCIELVKRIRKVDTKAAASFISGAGKLDANARPQQEVADGRKASEFDPLAYVKTLAVEHEALADLGIAPETLIEFKAGYCSKGLHRGRLAVAWQDINGVVKHFIGVALDKSLPLYLMPKSVQTPLWFNTSRVEDGAALHILPSIIHVMQAWENGEQNAICPLRDIDADALTSLQALASAKNLTVEF